MELIKSATEGMNYPPMASSDYSEFRNINEGAEPFGTAPKNKKPKWLAIAECNKKAWEIEQSQNELMKRLTGKYA